MASLIEPLSTQVPIVDNEGKPTPQFARLLQKLSLGNGLTVGEDGEIVLDDIDTQRVLGRNTAGTGAVEEVSLTQLLDWIGGAAHGDILYRDSATWDNLPAGTSGQFLKSNGAGADPSWSAPPSGASWTKVTEYDFAVNGAVPSVTGSVEGASEVLILCRLVTASVSGIRQVTVSTDGGSTYHTTSGDYQIITDTGTETATGGLGFHGTASTAARSGACSIFNPGETEIPRMALVHGRTDPMRYFVANATAISHVKFDNSGGGNITGGRVLIYTR